MTLEEAIAKLDLIASDAFEGGDANEFRQLAEWLRELKAYRDDRDDCDYKTLKIKLENAEDIIRGLQEDLRDAREELRWR